LSAFDSKHITQAGASLQLLLNIQLTSAGADHVLFRQCNFAVSSVFSFAPCCMLLQIAQAAQCDQQQVQYCSLKSAMADVSPNQPVNPVHSTATQQ
jgi:hypothetical protein